MNWCAQSPLLQTAFFLSHTLSQRCTTIKLPVEISTAQKKKKKKIEPASHCGEGDCCLKHLPYAADLRPTSCQHLYKHLQTPTISHNIACARDSTTQSSKWSAAVRRKPITRHRCCSTITIPRVDATKPPSMYTSRQ